MTAPLSISLKDTEIRIPILVLECTPVNLLGRDAIFKLKMQIWCTPDGIYVNDRAIRQMFQHYNKHKNHVLTYIG